MPKVGDSVIVLDPFHPFFLDTYKVERVDEANTTAWLEGVETAFDFSYLQVTP